MRLTSIEALHFGALENCRLTGMADGLTIVLGPNESGKSTFAAAARQVLYGFPDRRTTDHSYVTSAGALSAGLVFADETGEWAIKRVDGPHRGAVTVTPLSGPPRDNLLGEVVGGVNEQSFRVVFGFGLDELAKIESGGTADIVGRLYAAGSGLAVNPLDVRESIKNAADSLYAPRASKPVVNTIVREMKAVRDRIKVLEDEAARFADEQLDLEALAEQIEPLKAERDALDEKARVLGQDMTRLSDAAESLSELDEATSALERRSAELSRDLELSQVDERVLAAAPQIDAVLADESGFRAHLESADSLLREIEDAERTLGELEELPETASDSVADRAAVEEWASRLADLKAAARLAESAATAAEAQASATAQVAGGAVANDRSGVSPLVITAAVLAVLAGIGVLVVGLAQNQLVTAALGGLVVVASSLALVGALFRKKPGTGSPLTDQAAQTRTEAQKARLIADGTTAQLATAESEWKLWLASRALDFRGSDPAAVRVLLAEVAERRARVVDLARLKLEAKREDDAAEAWVVRLVDGVRSYDASLAQMVSPANAAVLSARAASDLRRAREARSERDAVVREMANQDVAMKDVSKRRLRAEGIVAEIVTRHFLAAASPLPSLAAAIERVRADLAETRERYDALSREHAALASRLGDEGRTNEMAVARQELQGLRAKAEAAAEAHVVNALAMRLVDTARERYEQDRQPEVVRIAAEVYKQMTDGRYVGLSVPLDNSGITIRASDGSVRSTEQLSRGAAEQLYLALRIGLIGSLGELGRWLPVLMDDVIVNFDPKRRDGAIVSITQLSAMRQVVFFTCHPDVAAALQEAVPASAFIKLDRCELRG